MRENANIQENDDHTGEGDNSSEDHSSEGEGDDMMEDNSSTGEEDDSSEDNSSESEEEGKKMVSFALFKEAFDQSFAKYHKNILKEPTGDEEPAPGSPDVESSTLTAMKVDNIDMNVSDVILPGTSSVKVSPKLVEESAKTRQFVRVTRKGRKKNLKDPNNCKAS